MPDKKKYKYFSTQIESVVDRAKHIIIPGFDRMPLYDVGRFFFKGIQKGSLSTRASSIAFHFFLAVFPALIFFFTLIPYFPVENMQGNLLNLLRDFLPDTAYQSVQETIVDLISKRREGLLSFGFLAALYFSTNGINSMIAAFNASYHSFETRSWFAQRLVSLILVLILTFLVVFAIVLIVFSKLGANRLVELGMIEKNFTYYFVMGGKWVIILALFFFAISFIYYMAPAKKTKWRFISAGGTLATLLTILTSLGFSFYVNNFGQYNKLYGSIGTLIVILMWMHLNSLILLIGFELNTSITFARQTKQKPALPEPDNEFDDLDN